MLVWHFQETVVEELARYTLTSLSQPLRDDIRTYLNTFNEGFVNFSLESK